MKKYFDKYNLIILVLLIIEIISILLPIFNDVVSTISDLLFIIIPVLSICRIIFILSKNKNNKQLLVFPIITVSLYVIMSLWFIYEAINM